MTTMERIRKIIAEQLKIEPSKITESTDLVADLNADSLEIAELLFMLEEELDITLDEEKVLKFKTVGDIVNLIDNNS